MLDVDTFLTPLYFMADNFYKARPAKQQRPGADASLSPSEVITLAIFARFSRFVSERAARGISIATLTSTCAAPSPLCPIARSSIASFVPTRNSSRKWPCIWRR